MTVWNMIGNIDRKKISCSIEREKTYDFMHGVLLREQIKNPLEMMLHVWVSVVDLGVSFEYTNADAGKDKRKFGDSALYIVKSTLYIFSKEHNGENEPCKVERDHVKGHCCVLSGDLI